MAGGLQRQGLIQMHDYTEVNGYRDGRQSLRLRRPLSQASNWNSPQYNCSSQLHGEDEEDASSLPQDIRTCPEPLAAKKVLWRAQQKQVTVASRRDSWKKAKTLRVLRDNSRAFLYYFAPWNKTLQLIGGNFGGGVQSFFLFLRFLVVLNFVSFLLIAGFVVIPSIVFRSVGNGLVNATGKEDCLNYDPNSQGLVAFYTYFIDMLSGTGFMEFTYMFYGFYDNTLVQDQNFSYNLPLAYLFTAVFYFAFCFICIIARMGRAARAAVAAGGGAAGNYSMIVFASWDYGCLGDKATKLKQKNIRYQLQVDLEEDQLKKKAASQTLRQKIILYSLRSLMFLLANGFIIAALYGIFEATNFSQERRGATGILSLIFEYLPSIVITAGNFVVPVLCDQIASIEQYGPSTTVIIALLRSVILRLVSLIVLILTLWRQVTCNGNISSDDCKLCNYNHKLYPCWETRVGQEMYRLTLFDLLISIAVLVLVDFPRRFVVDNLSKNKLVQWVGRQEFVVSSNVLALVYSQTVVWTGALFCPLLPLIGFLKFIIFFYCKKITLFYNCRPAQKTFRTTASTFFFVAVLLIGWALATAVMVYSLSEIQPSMSCGPFRILTYMWAIVPLSFYALSETTQKFLFFIGSQAFSIPLFMFLCVVLCYFIALCSVHGKSVALLRNQIMLEGRDKQFLVKQIQALSQ